ncbi:hypothetical protein [Prauserella cavernicola]|uniref:Uncharacterized protein n=1 Tax=Prauserella cavernicola TaxID=2800127 RepID=A0A934V3Q2_9PSEU|nr:hypothetical protein [Prauserella cavernicola]MBK1783280.1 hypothetical protein [Prauserella cavernicola]
MTGFGSVPDELNQVANSISDTAGRVAGLVWRGPSGDYGHADVQSCWGGFIEDARTRLESLRATAEEHGGGLVEAARRYLESEQDTGGVVASLHELVEGEAPVAGRRTHGIADVLGGGAN